MRPRIDVTGQRGRRTSSRNHPARGSAGGAVMSCLAGKGEVFNRRAGPLVSRRRRRQQSTQTLEGDMSEPVPRNAILASSSITGPGVIDHLNTILDDANLGRALG